ncbi:MAG: hypothetical protein EOM20_08190 [Spartobacteria bacterium]|nr:hypothetical protein [Spartobacteria bacterium]
MQKNLEREKNMATMKASGKWITVSELAYCAGTSRVMIQKMIQEELITPAKRTPEPVFETSIRPHVCKILRLHGQLGVGLDSMSLVLNLLDRIEQLEKAVGR